MKTKIVKLMPDFNALLYFMFIGVFGLLTLVTLVAAVAVDEGTNGDSQIGIYLARLFYIFRFPTHTILESTVAIGGWLTFMAGLFINCMFWALISERLISLVRHRRTLLELKHNDTEKSSS